MALNRSSSPPKWKGGGVATEATEAESGVEVPKRLDRRMKPFEQIGVLGLFVFTAAIFLLLLVNLLFAAYREDAAGLVLDRSWTSAVEGGGEECDWFEGEWVWDERYPLYKSTDCPFIDLGFRCSENGRPEDFYAKWRWQPSRCALPRFDAKKMLEKLRGRRLVFVGDSIGRNQWESLLCMLASVVLDKSSIYEVNGNPITKHMGFLIFRFKDYNCTIEYFRSPFLVVQGRPPPRVPMEVKSILRLDTLEWTSNKWKDADVLVFNSGHWWNFEKTIRTGIYFQVGDEVNMDMTVDSAYQRAIRTLLDWIHKEVNTSSTRVIFRTFSPTHFRKEDWKNGGQCHLEIFPDLGNPYFSLEAWSQFLKPLTNINKTLHPMIEILNVTKMTAFRKDGHLSLFYLGPSIRAPVKKQDCSHWCLPGVPDAWNELLYAIFMRR